MRHIIRYICRVCSIRSILFAFMLMFTVVPALIVYFSFKSFTLSVVADKYLNEYLMSLSSHIEYKFSAYEEQLNTSYLYFALYPDVLSDIEHGNNVDRLMESAFSDIPEISAAEFIVGDRVYTYRADGQTGSLYQNLSPEYLKSFGNDGLSMMNGVVRDKGKNYVVSGRNLYNYYALRNLGYIVFYTDEPYIYLLYKDLKTKNSSIFITSGNCVISHDDTAAIGKEVFIPGSVFSDGKSDKLSKTLMSRSNIKNAFGGTLDIISVVTYDGIFSVISSLNKIVLLVLIIAVLFMLIVSMIISKNCLKNIGQLNLDIINFAENPDKYKPHKFSGEIASLENQFNEMVIRIKELIKNNELEREKKHIAELCTLQAQIKHHFVYNALDIVYWKAHENNQPEIEKIVLALSSFFRTSLSCGDNFITVREEISHVKNYLIIEQMRFENMFDAEFDISEDILDISMLKIILQPIVENCIKHGFKDITYRGHILIKGRLHEENLLVFDVVDNGCGISKDPLSVPKQTREKISYGLSNISERLKFEYGKTSGIEFLDVGGRGSHVVVTIDLKHSRGSDANTNSNTGLIT